MTDDEQRRARRSEALAAAREAARDGGQGASDETDDADRDARGQGDERQSSQRDARGQGDERRSGQRDERRGRRAERERQQGGRERQQGGHERQQGGHDRHSESRGRTRRGEQVERVSAVDHDAALVTAFEHDGYDCELGQVGDDFFGFVRVPPDHDRLHLMWELDVPGEFGYGPDADGWVGFDTSPVDRELSPREAAMALAGLAAQVAERSRSRPK